MLGRLSTRSKRISIWSVIATMTLGLLSACGGGSDPPAAPTQLSAVGGDSEVSLGWLPSSGASKYNLYWSESAGVTKASGTKLEDVAAPYVQTGLANGLTYFYVVTAVNGDGESAASAEASATLAPNAPVAVSAVAGATDVTVSWDATVAGATSYNLYWSTTPGVTTATGIKEVDAKTPFVHTGRASGQTYYYVVTALNDGGESPASAEASASLAPAAPTALSAVSGNAQVTIEWNDVDIVGATSYNLYWSITAGVTKATGTKVAGVTVPFVHTGLSNGTTYYYVVTSVGTGGESVESAQASATPQVPLPTAPQAVSAIATPETTKSVTISWSPPTDPTFVTSYTVYRSTTPGIVLPNSLLTQKLNAVSPYIDIVPAGQTTYYYVVTASTAGGEGPASAEVSATPKGPPNGGGSGETGFGNNLSVPLVFADGVGILGGVITGADYKDLATGLRPTASDTTDPFPYLNPADIASLGGVDYYEQQSSSTWQASWVNNALAGAQKVEVDWGDNLSSASLSSSQVIRVETVLRQYKGLPVDGTSWSTTESMVGYPMQLLYGQGKAEMQGTTGTAADATERRVFAATARLTIEKLDGAGNVVPSGACGFNGSIADGLAMADGSQVPKYSSEVNVGGSLTYGFNWRLNKCTGLGDKTGNWRLTFSLDPSAKIGDVTYLNNTVMYGLHPSQAGSTATLSADGTSTSIIVNVK
jgi:fibronectin type 3 domain-containing protein